MTQMEQSIGIIMEGKVKNLIGLSDDHFDLVLAMLYSARLSRPYEVKREDKPSRKVKHGKQASR